MPLRRVAADELREPGAAAQLAAQDLEEGLPDLVDRRVDLLAVLVDEGQVFHEKGLRVSRSIASDTMTRLGVSIENSTGDALRAHVQDLSALLEGEHVDLAALGKVFGKIAQTLLEAIEQSGESSLRFRAVATALDLKTAKSRLLAFLGDS